MHAYAFGWAGLKQPKSKPRKIKVREFQTIIRSSSFSIYLVWKKNPKNTNTCSALWTCLLLCSDEWSYGFITFTRGVLQVRFVYSVNRFIYLNKREKHLFWSKISHGFNCFMSNIYHKNTKNSKEKDSNSIYSRGIIMEIKCIHWTL